MTIADQQHEPTPIREPALTLRRVSARAAIGASAIAVALGSAACGGSSPSSSSTTSASLPPARVVGAPIKVGTEPAGIAYGGGRIWVANQGTGSVSEIDPSTATTVGSINVEAQPLGVTYGHGSIWVACLGGQAVEEIDPATARVIHTIKVAQPTSVTYGAGRIWFVGYAPVGSGAGLGQIDGATGTLGYHLLPTSDQSLFISAPEASGLAYGAGRIWAGGSDSDGDSTVSVIDPATSRIVGSIPVGSSGHGGVAYGAGRIWVISDYLDLDPNNSNDEGTAWEIDPATVQTVGSPIRVGKFPEGVAYGAGRIWVTNYDDGTVSEIDPTTARTVGSPIRVGRWPFAVAYGAGRIWVTHYGGALRRPSDANPVGDTVSEIIP